MNPFLIPGLETPSQPHTPAGLVILDVFAIQGEKGTGFEKAGDLGEFECGNCLWFDAAAGACNQMDMKAMSQQPRLADGRVSVADADCCEYVQRVGRKDLDKDDEHGRE